MVLTKKNNFIKGYLQIEIEGFYIERFFNACTKQGIELWGTKRKNNTSIITNIKIDDFRGIRNIARKTQCSMKIKRKKGIPFIIRKYKNRKVFIFLFFILILSIFTLSNFVWNIEIEGNNIISSEEILEELNKNGIKQGELKYKINIQKVIEKMRLNDERISWIGIKIDGTNAKVNIVEAVAKPDILDENEYCDIIASKDGIITKINVTNGTELVKEGDVVERGRKLIGGWMEGKYTGTRYVHAEGEVKAKAAEAKKAANAKKIAEVEKNFPGFAVDANGIYWKTTKAGNGVKIGGRKNVACEYKGYLVDGRVFDQSAGRGPLEFVTASGQMIPGFDIMVQDMSLGEKRTVVIPSDFAYGDQGYPGVIPGGAYIAFDIEVVKAR